MFETRKSSIFVSSLKNHFNLNDAFVVTSQGQSGGLWLMWLMWTDEVELSIFDHSQTYILAICTNKNNFHYGLVCIYGDPRHRSTTVIWDQVQNFVSHRVCLVGLWLLQLLWAMAL
jgi:hypothetical protein